MHNSLSIRAASRGFLTGILRQGGIVLISEGPVGMLIGFAVVFAIRVFSAIFRWSLPKARQLAESGSADEDGRE